MSTPQWRAIAGYLFRVACLLGGLGALIALAMIYLGMTL